MSTANPWSIELLAHTDPGVAEAIRIVMVAAYQVEAALLGVQDFVPLYRTAPNIAAAEAVFLGIRVSGVLAAVAEVEHDPRPKCHIGSLVVHPMHFRKGLATALLCRIVAMYPGQEITVSTGALNGPALQLYAAQGFVEHHCWTTPDAIPMKTLQRLPDSISP